MFLISTPSYIKQWQWAGADQKCHTTSGVPTEIRQWADICLLSGILPCTISICQHLTQYSQTTSPCSACTAITSTRSIVIAAVLPKNMTFWKLSLIQTRSSADYLPLAVYSCHMSSFSLTHCTHFCWGFFFVLFFLSGNMDLAVNSQNYQERHGCRSSCGNETLWAK